MSDEFIIGETAHLEARFTLAGVPSTTSTGFVYLRRNDDDTYYNGSGHQVARISLAMDEVSDAQAAGFHRYDFVLTSIAAGSYTVETEDTSGNSDNPQSPYSIKIIANTVIDNQVDIEAKIDIVDTVVDAIKVSTDNLPADPTSEATATVNTNAILALISSADDTVGRVIYNSVTSILTEYEVGQPTTVRRQFNIKDKNGNPAGANPPFERVEI